MPLIELTHVLTQTPSDTHQDILEYALANPIPDDLVKHLVKTKGHELEVLMSVFINEILPNEGIIALDDQQVIQYVIHAVCIPRVDHAAGLGCCNGFRVRKNYYRWVPCMSVETVAVYAEIRNHQESMLHDTKLPTRYPDFNPMGLLLKNSELAKTQKAQGIFYLANSAYGELPSSLYPVKSSHLFTSIRESYLLPYDKDISSLQFPIFIRPCPYRPRHGFIESITSRDPDDILLMFVATRALDPNGELIVAPALKGNFSMVMTPTLVTYGYENTGATSGRGFDIPYPRRALLPHKLLHPMGITNELYIECVHDTKRGIQIVQARNGPRISQHGDYIPKNTCVKRVISAGTQNMLEYEQKIKHSEPGTVVYGSGSGLASHYAAHAIAHEIPYITSFCPTVGDTLKAVADPLDCGQWTAIATYIKELQVQPLFLLFGADKKHDGMTQALSNACKLSILTGHLTLIWPKNQVGLNYLSAYGLVSFIALYMFSLLGELRHIYNYKKSAHYHDSWVHTYTNKSVYSELISIYGHEIPRYSFYHKMMYRSMKSLLSSLPALATDFLLPCWQGGIAGPNWAHATYSMQLLVEAYTNFLNHPNKENWVTMVSYWHTCINEQHNSGNILNKFVSVDTFDAAAFNQPALFLQTDFGQFITDNILTQVIS